MIKLWRLLIVGAVLSTMITFLIVDHRSNLAGLITKQADETELFEVGTAIGELAPNFEGKTLNNDVIQLSDFRGKIVLINIFASWCGPCRLETPHLVDTFAKLDPDQFIFIGINLEESPETVAQFDQEYNINYPLVLNEHGDLTDGLYTPIGLPTSWFIDSNGLVRYVFTGAMTSELLMQTLEDIQMGREPNPFNISG